MRARTRALIGVGVMVVVLALYFVLTGVRAVALLASGTPLAIVMGAALLILPLIGAWAILRELRFGWRSTALVDQLERAGRLPGDLGETGPTGKPDREVADRVFPRYRSETESDPENWQAWVRLGIVYDACGDRTRARSAMRNAVRLSRSAAVDPESTR